MEEDRKKRITTQSKVNRSNFNIALLDPSKTSRIDLTPDDNCVRCITPKQVADLTKRFDVAFAADPKPILRICEKNPNRGGDQASRVIPIDVTIEKFGSSANIEYKIGKEGTWQSIRLGEEIGLQPEMFINLGGVEFIISKIEKIPPRSSMLLKNPFGKMNLSPPVKNSDTDVHTTPRSSSRVVDLVDGILAQRESTRKQERIQIDDDESSDLSGGTPPPQPLARRKPLNEHSHPSSSKKGDIFAYTRAIMGDSTGKKEGSTAHTSGSKGGLNFDDVLAQFGKFQQEKHARRDEENSQRREQQETAIETEEQKDEEDQNVVFRKKKTKEHLYETFRRLDSNASQANEQKPASEKHYIRLKKVATKSNPQVPRRDCAICLSEIQEELGRLSCNHYFCYDCIWDWSKVTNVCPLCKREFRFIQKLDKDTEVVHKTIKVARKRQTFEDDNIEWIIDENCDESCYECRRGDDETRLLVCDWCNWYCCHLYCLDPPLEEVPTGSWYCKFCLSDGEEEARHATRATRTSRRSRSRQYNRNRDRFLEREAEQADREARNPRSDEPSNQESPVRLSPSDQEFVLQDATPVNHPPPGIKKEPPPFAYFVGGRSTEAPQRSSLFDSFVRRNAGR